MENKYIELKKLLSLYNPNITLKEVLELISPFCEIEERYEQKKEKKEEEVKEEVEEELDIEKPIDRFAELRELADEKVKPKESVKELDKTKINKLVDDRYEKLIEEQEKSEDEDDELDEEEIKVRCERCKKRINILDEEESGIYRLTGLCVNCFDDIKRK